METRHRPRVGDARDLSDLDDDAVELVVTSPPYPMIEMWDATFASMDPAIAEALEAGAGTAAFDRMHDALETVWGELRRVVVDGGIVCVNVGDATRRVDGSFRVWQNHARIVDAFDRLGFEPLPEILWRKPTNSAAKFMGSGMLPPNAYATLEHEYVLPFRNGPDSRSFEPHEERRYAAAYFWEERNEWFSDLWSEVTGERQALADPGERERSAAFPLEIPYRLINMYSVYGDTVLDPFWGTGTTGVAAMLAGRDSIGYELDESLLEGFERRLDGLGERSRELVAERLGAHRRFVRDRGDRGDPPAYEARHLGCPVVTRQERGIRLYVVDGIARDGDDCVVTYREVEDADPASIRAPDMGSGEDSG